MEISIEEAYKEACLALGESIVRERLLSARFVQQTASANNSRAGGDVAADSGISPDN